MEIGTPLSTSEENDCYRIDRELKSGGQGTAYLATYLPDGMSVVIKAVRADVLVNEPDMANLCPLEGRVGEAVILHPNVVKTFAYVPAQHSGRDIAYIVMEYVDGTNLADYLDRQDIHLEQDQMLTWMRQLVSGLEAIHTVAIHRDIKPRNVMVSEDALKIIDFGMARFGTDETLTAARGKGSHKYMAPETWQGTHGSAATDVYSLGILFYQMATLKLPYVAENDEDLRELHQHGPIPRPSAERPKLDPRLNKLIMTMMAHDASARPSVADIAQTLDEIRREPTPPLPAALERVLVSAEAAEKRRAEFEAQRRAQEEIFYRRVRHATHGVNDLTASIDELISLFNTQTATPITSGQDNSYTTNGSLFDYAIVNRTYGYNGRHLQVQLQGMPFENKGPDSQALSGPGQSALAFGTVGVTYIAEHRFSGGHSFRLETEPHGYYLLLEGSPGTAMWQAYTVEKAPMTDGDGDAARAARRPLLTPLNVTMETFVEILRTSPSSNQGFNVRHHGPVDPELLGGLLNALVGDGFTDGVQGGSD